MSIVSDSGLGTWEPRIAEILQRDAVPLTSRQLIDIVVEAAGPADAVTKEESEFLQRHAGLHADDLTSQALQRADAAVALSEVRSAAAARRNSITSQQAAELLHTAASNVRRSIGSGRLYSLGVSEGSHRLPTWQFTADGRALPGLKRILDALPEDYHPLDVATFMATAEDALGGRSPAAWLEDGGGIERVVALADERAWE